MCQICSFDFGFQIGPLRCWPGGLCLSRSIGDVDVGEYIVPIPHVKQVKVCHSNLCYMFMWNWWCKIYITPLRMLNIIDEIHIGACLMCIFSVFILSYIVAFRHNQATEWTLIFTFCVALLLLGCLLKKHRHYLSIVPSFESFEAYKVSGPFDIQCCAIL